MPTGILGAIVIVLAACSSGPPAASGLNAPSPLATAGPVTATAADDVSAAAPTSQYALVVVARAIDVRTGAGAHHPIAEAGFADNGQVGSLPIALQNGELAWVLDDPVTVAGEAWVHVAFKNRPYDDGRFLTGWIPAGDGEAGSVAPLDPSSRCPGLHGRAENAVGGLRRLACFGSEPFSVTGVIRAGDAECNAHWLTCAAAYLTGDLGDPLPLYLDPALEVALPPPGAHAQVHGRIEHPSASGCAIGAIGVERAAAAVLYCRSRVVVESVTAPPGPLGQIGEPAPVLEVVGIETIADGAWNRYSLRIANAADYPAALFASAPSDLPDCGANAHSARAWVEIVAESGAPITTFCALSGSEGLRDLYFTGKADLPAPAVFVEINDRVDEVVYRSNTVRFDGE